MLKNYEKNYEELRKVYHKVYLPAKDDFKCIDLGRAIYGEDWKKSIIN